jgi:hypothetical protein
MTTIEKMTVAELEDFIRHVDELITGNLAWAAHVGTEPDVDDLYEELRQAEAKRDFLAAKQKERILALLK